ncbi:MAG: hypothetical protein FJ137_08880 [Deltaproteobacteria bacterium]|nr:hypothetical protein [Deltaproteobacteria bacterium]
MVMPAAPPEQVGPRPAALLSWRRSVGRLLRLGGGSDRNEVTRFVGGDDAFGATLGAIERATTRAWLEPYVFCPTPLA